MDIHVRRMGPEDQNIWATLRQRLWDHLPVDDHVAEIKAGLIQTSLRGFIAETATGIPAGFAEVSIRPYANGCTEMPVAFLEGIWVDDLFRSAGVGGLLVQFIAAELAAEGRVELCSDVPLENTVSQDAHVKWGFEETERVVYFRKSLV